jgi:hypothetical protein
LTRLFAMFESMPRGRVTGGGKKYFAPINLRLETH